MLGRRQHGRRTALILVVMLALLTGCSQTGNSTTTPTSSGTDTAPMTPEVIEVPADAPTITAALELAAPGSVVLVGPGTYPESVLIDTPDVTLRGTDRAAVVIDGEGLRANGVQVIADGVRVENLTVINHTFNGVIVTGMHDENGVQAHNLSGYETLDPEKFPPLRRFSVSHVTASNNGLYGIYAFNARNGAITDNYASGSADSGFYVGQCEECQILVTGNVAENNAIGYENANASDSVLIAGNRFVGNRVGMTLISWYQEAFIPQRGDVVVGNLIAANTSATSPAHVDGAFGLGVGLAGAQDNTFVRNMITANPVAGVQITNTEDIPSTGTSFDGNAFGSNGIDIADVSAPRTPSWGTCFASQDEDLTTAPEQLGSFVCPDGAPEGMSSSSEELPGVDVPAGMSFLQVPRGPEQPGLVGDLRALPDPLPEIPDMPAPEDFPLPGADLLADRAAVKVS